ncbi:Clr5 domain-containing protein [Colletotrichum cereale]|nr:Clr5 domain-containing protein [Colletotrichum cereale]
MDDSRNTNNVGMPLTSRKCYATDDVWNCQRQTITRLYRDEKKSLKEVQHIMERDYSLYSTERMFKTRIQNWGLNKKLKEPEVLHIFQLNERRKAIGKKSEFFIRNQKVDWERLMRYLDRRPDLRHKLYGFVQDSADVHVDIICRTPSPVLDTSILSGPFEMRLPEEMLRISKGYFEGGLDSQWTIKGDNIHCFDEKFRQLHVVEMRTHMDNAITLLGANKMEHAFCALNNSLDSLGQSIKEQDPLLFYILSYRVLQLGPKITDSVIAFTHEMHAAILGHNHPLTLVWSKFRCLSVELQAKVLSMMAASCVPLLNGRLEMLNRMVALGLGSTSTVLSTPGEVNGSYFEQLLSKYSAATELYFAAGDYQSSCECLLVVAVVHSWGQQYGQSKGALARAYALIQGSERGPDSPWLQLELSYYEIMASLLYQTGRPSEALDYGHRAYNHTEQHFQSPKPQSLRAIRNLIDLCRQTGLKKEAEQWCNTLLARMSDDVGI